MSLAQIEPQIKKFLSTENAEVMVIKGKWGIGKTFAWNKFILSEKSNIKLKKYSYVSLFGINSLDTFKYTIFEQKIACELIGKEVNLETLKNNVEAIFGITWRKTVKTIGDNISSFSSFKLSNFNDMIFLSVNRIIVCIDDLERKGKDLSIKDIMGLISVLKEQKHCKVVLILNDNEEGLDDYKKYLEKVVDFELEFTPTAEECANIVFNHEHNILKLEIVEIAKKATIDLNITNIRILKKIERLVSLINPYIADYNSETIKIIVRKLIFLTWCVYSHNINEVPSLEYITKSYSAKIVKMLVDKSLQKQSDKKEVNKEEQKQQEKEIVWDKIIATYSFSFNKEDKFDSCLLKIIQKGYIDENEAKFILDKKNKNILSLNGQDEFNKIFNFYFNTFGNPIDTIINEIEKSFRKNIKYLYTPELNSIVTFFKQLDKKSLANILIDAFIAEKRNENLAIFEEQNFPFNLDEDIRIKFAVFYNTNNTHEPVKNILQRIHDRRSWSQIDSEILAKTTVDEYYETFKETQDNLQHLDLIRVALDFEKRSKENDSQVNPYNSVTEALQRIAKESKINQLIIQRFGINTDL